MANKQAYKPPRRYKDPTRSDEPFSPWVQKCSQHGKRLYLVKAEAKRVARLHQPAKSVYRCVEFPALWHVGSLPRAVKIGVMDRRDLYQEAV